MTNKNTERARRKPTINGAAVLLSKLKQIGLVSNDSIKDKQSIGNGYCQFVNGTIAATDGILTVGVMCEEQFAACPHTKTLIKALEKCGETLSMTVDQNQLIIKSGKFKAAVQCVPPEALVPVRPDPAIAPINDNVKKALHAASIYSKEGAEKVLFAAVFLQAYSAIGTNGFSIIESRHGFDLPPSLALPKRFVDLVVKSDCAVTGFGYSPNRSVTFWFEDGSFIKCLLFTEPLPNFERVLNVNHNQFPIPSGFFDAVRSVYEFGDGYIEFVENGISSHPVKASSANAEIGGLPVGRKFDAKALLALEPYVTTADFNTYDDRIVFYGEQSRAVVMGIR